MCLRRGVRWWLKELGYWWIRWQWDEADWVGGD